MKICHIVSLIFLLNTLNVSAEGAFFEAEEFIPTVKKSHDPLNLVEGEHITPSSLSYYWDVNDIYLKTNGQLPLRLDRSYAKASADRILDLGSWALEIPRIQLTSSKFGSTNGELNGLGLCEDISPILWDRRETSTKMGKYDLKFFELLIPGEAPKQIVKANASTRATHGNIKYVTSDNWIFKCVNSKTDYKAKNTFFAISPDGVEYTFDAIGREPSPTYASGSTSRLNAYVTKIEDRFGNTLTYSYDNHIVYKKDWKRWGGRQLDDFSMFSDFSRPYLNSITSSDGQVIDVHYKKSGLRKYIDTVTANGKSWVYNYTKINKGNQNIGAEHLTSVLYPDGMKDTYYYNALDNDYFGPNGLTNPLGVKSDGSDKVWPIEAFRATGMLSQLSKVITRAGLEIEYKYDDKDVVWWVPPGGSASIPLSYWPSRLGKHIFSSLTSLKTRRVKSNHSDYDEWVFTRKPALYNVSKKDKEIADDKKLVIEINTPENKLVYKYHNVSSKNENDEWLQGQLLSLSIYDKSADVETSQPVRKSIYDYINNGAFGDSAVLLNPRVTNARTKASVRSLGLRVLPKKKSIYEGDTTYEKIFQKFDEFNNITETKESLYKYGKSQLIRDKYYKYTYYNDVQLWVLGLKKRSYVSDTSRFITPFEDVIYDSSTALPYETKIFNRIVNTTTYHPDGNLKKTTYNGSNRYEIYEDYFRGIPQKITQPCPIDNTCNTVNGSTRNTVIAKQEINRDGTTKSLTDFNGHKTSYAYNPAGWLTHVNYAFPKLADKVISYDLVRYNDDGIPGSGIIAGSLKQTVTQGNYERTVYFDGLSRPIFTKERDNRYYSTIQYRRTAYSYQNGPILESFPSRSASNTMGIETKYDALGRAISIKRKSDSATTEIAYLNGNKRQVTDPKKNIITTTYLAYGYPNYSQPTLIEAPDSSNTSINYNQFGQITAITQGGVTEKRLYDSYQQLCKTYRPETGVTAFGYNSQRQPIWRAEGTNGGSGSCATSSVPVSHKVLLGYDNLGQLRSENFPDNTPDNTYGYDANGNLVSLISGSGSRAISWSYLYNSMNAIDKETLSIDGKSFVLDWGYNNLGAVSSLKYPSGRSIAYSPNALGQPTKVSEGVVNYAKNIKYHPNGQIQQLTYGNGIVRNIDLDTSGRIDAIRDSKGRSKLNIDPRYDLNDNVTGVIDWVDRSNDIDNMSYDGVNRLETASGKWGSGRYSYDGLGNIQSRSISGSSINYHYNSANRLNNLSVAYAYTYTYDTRGNVTHNGRYGLNFNRANQVTNAKGIPYRYDGHNRRVKKNSDYSLYSKSGQLLYRQAANGKKTDTVYLGKQIIAEIDLTGAITPPVLPKEKPSITLYFSSNGNGHDIDCPKGFVCPSAPRIPIVPPKDNIFLFRKGIPIFPTNSYVLSWTTRKADSCSGKAFRNGSVSKTLTGTSHLGINFINDGALYTASLTCTGPGGSTTKTAIIGGNGDEY